VGLNSVRVEGKHQKFNLFEVLKVSPLSQDIDNSLRQKQFDINKADKRIREREGIEPCSERVIIKVASVTMRKIFALLEQKNLLL
jgi:hypothetical protein